MYVRECVHMWTKKIGNIAKNTTTITAASKKKATTINIPMDYIYSLNSNIERIFFFFFFIHVNNLNIVRDLSLNVRCCCCFVFLSYLTLANETLIYLVAFSHSFTLFLTSKLPIYILYYCHHFLFVDFLFSFSLSLSPLFDFCF